MLPTPDIAHVRRAEYGGAVYDPAEDTFALMDALEKDAAALANVQVCVEIGCGSGCVLAFAAQIIGAGAVYLGTDINPLAAACTLETADKNRVQLQPVLTSTVEGLSPRLDGQVDLLLFNPPYVVTSEEEEAAAQTGASIGGAWAGGTYGTALLQRVLARGTLEVGLRADQRLLRPGGRCYVVAIKQNDPEALVQQLQHQGMQAEIVLRRRANREHLHILRIVRATDTP